MLEEGYLFALDEVFGMAEVRGGKFRLELLWVAGRRASRPFGYGRASSDCRGLTVLLDASYNMTIEMWYRRSVDYTS